MINKNFDFEMEISKYILDYDTFDNRELEGQIVGLLRIIDLNNLYGKLEDHFVDVLRDVFSGVYKNTKEITSTSEHIIKLNERGICFATNRINHSVRLYNFGTIKEILYSNKNSIMEGLKSLNKYKKVYEFEKYINIFDDFLKQAKEEIYTRGDLLNLKINLNQPILFYNYTDINELSLFGYSSIRLIIKNKKGSVLKIMFFKPSMIYNGFKKLILYEILKRNGEIKQKVDEEFQKFYRIYNDITKQLNEEFKIYKMYRRL